MVSRQRALSRPFKLVAGHTVLDFVNTLDDRFAHSGPVELLNTYDDLIRFVSQAELIDERQLLALRKLDLRANYRSAVLGEARQLREALADVFYALLDHQELPNGALRALELGFIKAAGHRRLTLQETGDRKLPFSLAWQYQGVGEEVRSPFWLLAQAANDLLTSPHASDVRKCATSTCQWLFLDTSKNHTRRWCDMKVCGNRNKARLFHLRRTVS